MEFVAVCATFESYSGYSIGSAFLDPKKTKQKISESDNDLLALFQKTLGGEGSAEQFLTIHTKFSKEETLGKVLCITIQSKSRCVTIETMKNLIHFCGPPKADEENESEEADAAEGRLAYTGWGESAHPREHKA